MKPNDIETTVERPLPTTPPPARAARPRLKTNVRAGLFFAVGGANVGTVTGVDDWEKHNV